MSDTAPSPAQEKIRESFSPTFYAAFTNLDKPSREAFCKLLEATQQAGLDWWQIKQGKTTSARCGRFQKIENDVRTTSFFTYNASSGKIWTTTSSTKIPFGQLGGIPRTPLVQKLDQLIEELGKGPLDTIHPRLKRRSTHVTFLPTGPSGIGLSTSDEEDDMDRTGNWIYYGPPGTGKTYTLNAVLQDAYGKSENAPELKDDNQNKLYAFVTFHQSYGYEEFVEGLRPILENDDKGADTQPLDKDAGNQQAGKALAQKGDVRYEIRPGIFKALCEKAREAQKATRKGERVPRYAMVIDEINRGNISKIFGELITLIEDDKREGMPNAVSVTLPYSRDSFSVPANVDIIGTMNTADRSLALLDTALRRRFEFVPMLPDPSVLDGIQIKDAKDINLVQMLTKMNERIEVLYDRDHCIGHAYFTKLKDQGENKKPATLGELGSIFKNKILPLLQEYFFEDWNKIRLVLGDKNKPKNAQFIHETKMDSKELTDILGANHGLDSESLAPRYEVNLGAFDEVSAYTGIYAPSKTNESQVSTEPNAA